MGMKVDRAVLREGQVEKQREVWRDTQTGQGFGGRRGGQRQKMEEGRGAGPAPGSPLASSVVSF